MKNIAVFFGGKSCEHDISIITGFQVCKNLNAQKYNIFPIYITPQGKWFWVKNLESVTQFNDFSGGVQVFLRAGENVLYSTAKFKNNLAKLDCAIIACHGMNGEDGTLQGLLELSFVPYSSGGVASSAITMDKVFMKQIFEVNNLPVVPYFWFKKNDYLVNPDKILKEISRSLEFPVIVKPANLGSSIGIKKCQNLSQVQHAIQVAFCYDAKILVEEVVPHLREMNCAVLGFDEDVILGKLEQPKSWQEFLSFDDKYLQFNGKFAKNKQLKIDKSLKSKIKNIAKKAFKNLDCAGAIRIDFLLNEDTEELFVNEINSIPGSFANFLFDKNFSSILDDIIMFAEKKFAQKQSCSFSYQSDVLKKFDASKKLNKNNN